jgi:hypothetical protein
VTDGGSSGLWPSCSSAHRWRPLALASSCRSSRCCRTRSSCRGRARSDHSAERRGSRLRPGSRWCWTKRPPPSTASPRPRCRGHRGGPGRADDHRDRTSPQHRAELRPNHLHGRRPDRGGGHMDERRRIERRLSPACAARRNRVTTCAPFARTFDGSTEPAVREELVSLLRGRSIESALRTLVIDHFENQSNRCSKSPSVILDHASE